MRFAFPPLLSGTVAEVVREALEKRYQSFHSPASLIMDKQATGEELDRPIWLLAHSYPPNWADVLDGPLDSRHPTRHSIWTPVLESLQGRVYTHGNGRRLDMKKCHIDNAAAKQPKNIPPDWALGGASITAEKELFRSRVEKHSPRIVITFGADVFWFATTALGRNVADRREMTAKFLGKQFRLASNAATQGPMIFPLLHAFVAQGGWMSAGEYYSEEKSGNYFEFVGEKLGDVLLAHALDLPIWVNHALRTGGSQ